MTHVPASWSALYEFRNQSPGLRNLRFFRIRVTARSAVAIGKGEASKCASSRLLFSCRLRCSSPHVLAALARVTCMAAATPDQVTNRLVRAAQPAGHRLGLPRLRWALPSSWAIQTLTIKAGQAVTFTDPASSGGTHDLVTGTHGQFTAASGAPTAFGTQDGTDFSPGMSKTITFPIAGTFKITCTIHPPMQAVITVTP